MGNTHFNLQEKFLCQNFQSSHLFFQDQGTQFCILAISKTIYGVPKIILQTNYTELLKTDPVRDTPLHSINTNMVESLL